MYLAELHGKLSSKLQNMEDILTSNVFSFFKYTNRTIFLNRFMKRLGFVFTEIELQTAEFIFWPSLDDQTEPDLVLVIGTKYIMVEAKYFAGFEPETRSRKAQLIREIEGGLREAENMNLDFYLVAITADYTYRKERLKLIQDRCGFEFNWINWQAALKLAEQECLADEEVRALRRVREAERRKKQDREYIRQFSDAILDLYPKCPARTAKSIAEHACLKYSGRVGRSAAAKSFDVSAVRLAVVAHVRHTETEIFRTSLKIRFRHVVQSWGSCHYILDSIMIY